MTDWVVELDKFAENFGSGVLKDAGTVSHTQAAEKVTIEYRKYQVKTRSPVEEAYFDSIKALDLLPNNFMPAKRHIRLQAIFENLEIALLFLRFPQTAFARI